MDHHDSITAHALQLLQTFQWMKSPIHEDWVAFYIVHNDAFGKKKPRLANALILAICH